MKTFSLWSNEDGTIFTLVEGLDKLKFGNGSVDQDCFEVVHSFEAIDLEHATDIKNEYLNRK